MKITALILAFYMAVGSLIPRTDFSQLVYLGDMKAHYLEHKAEAALQNLDLSFIDFLSIHFVNTNEHSDDNHEEDHHKLPLETINSTTSYIIDQVVLLDFTTPISLFTQEIVYTSPFYLSGFLSTAIQPPSC